MLLSLEEIVALFGDVVEGLAFLVSPPSAPSLYWAERLAALKLHSSPRSEMQQCPSALGRQQADVSASCIGCQSSCP